MTLSRQQLAVLLVGGGIVAGLAFGLFLYFQAVAAQQTMLLVPKQRVVVASTDILDQSTVINYNYMREKYNLAPAPIIDATRPGAARTR